MLAVIVATPKAGASLTIAALVFEHPYESVIVTEYVAAVKPEIVVPVDPLLQRYVKGGVPVNPVI